MLEKRGSEGSFFFFFFFFYKYVYHNYQIYMYLDFAHNSHKILSNLFDYP